jgi:Xaa-Pro aminopeptidase
MNSPSKRLTALRERMRGLGLTHYLVSSADEHLNEYLPERNLRRRWLTGFTGSAGDCLVSLDPSDSYLFADGRYHVQAAAEIDTSALQLMRVGEPGVPALTAHVQAISSRQSGRLNLGIDPLTVSASLANRLRTTLGRDGAELTTTAGNLVDELWSDRPANATSLLLELTVDQAGESAAEKIARVRGALAESGCSTLVCVKLDQIAWLLNLRSFDDVPYNPVFCAFLVLDRSRVILHVHDPARRIPIDLAKRIPGFEARAYESFRGTLDSIRGESISIDSDRLTDVVVSSLGVHNRLLEQMSPIEDMKATKNAVEIAQMRSANLLASVAKTRTILWASAACETDREISETALRKFIEAEYARLPGFRSLSFPTIAGAGDHGALPHYSGADDAPIENGELVVLDSGIQIAAGTTDDTRTLGFGSPNDEQRRIFTLVLRAHIQGAAAVFPEGTSGSAIDALVRNPLWANGLDYAHGTGHGVGALLNVHEGPFQIGDVQRRPSSLLPLRPGMVTSIEPGYYRIGFGGVRHENLYLVVDHHRDQGGRRWLAFEPLTFVPFDAAWIDVGLLDAREALWLKEYQRACCLRLNELLDAEQCARLKRYAGLRD